MQHRVGVAVGARRTLDDARRLVRRDELGRDWAGAAASAATSPVGNNTANGTSTATSLPSGFVKGQLHAHTGRSGDSRTPPERVHAWYEARGYDFIVFTDHNVVTDTPDTALLTIPGVEITQNSRRCDPSPTGTDACLLHVNALFVDRPPGPLDLRPPSSGARVDIYRHGLALTEALGGVAMLNHPNMHYGADASTIVALAESKLVMMEVGNQAWDSRNDGDASHPSTEALWDHVLSRGHRVWATVTDDAHHYDDVAEARARGEDVFAGDLGFVAVRAAKEAAAIRRALERGDFYGATGVVFSRLELDAKRCVLEVSGDGDVRFEVISRGGKVVHEATGRALDYEPKQRDGGYVRFRVRDQRGRFAITQPVFL